jgi:hypothetical protein
MVEVQIADIGDKWGIKRKMNKSQAIEVVDAAEDVEEDVDVAESINSFSREIHTA